MNSKFDKFFGYTFGVLGMLFSVMTIYAMFLTPFNELLFVVMASCWLICISLFLIIFKS